MDQSNLEQSSLDSNNQLNADSQLETDSLMVSNQLVQEYIPNIPNPGPPIGTNEIPPFDETNSMEVAR